MAGKQQEFDFTRGSQLRLLRQVKFPKSTETPYGGVSGIMVKAVLKAIDDFAWGKQEAFPSITTISETTCSSVSQVNRALWVLRDRSLICSDRRMTPKGTIGNHYRIVWTELAVLVDCRPMSHGEPDHRLMAPDHRLMAPDHRLMAPDHRLIDETCNRKRIGSALEPPPPTETWEVVEVDLLRAGVAAAGKAVSSARSNGCTPGHIRSILREFQRLQASAPGAWGLGALKWRVSIASPALDVRDGWPPPSETVVAAAASQSQSQSRAAQLAAQSQRSEAVAFIREARKRGLDDDEIRSALAARELEWP